VDADMERQGGSADCISVSRILLGSFLRWSSRYSQRGAVAFPNSFASDAVGGNDPSAWPRMNAAPVDCVVGHCDRFRRISMLLSRGGQLG